MKGFPDIPPMWWAGSVAIIYAAKWVAPWAHVHAGLLSVLASLLFVAGLSLIVWSAIWFRRKKTPIEPHHTPKALIVEGPYRLSRNPIYLALVLLTAAFTLRFGSIVGVLATFGLWWVLDRRFAATEEAKLQAQFGREAEDYIAQTRRWI